MSRSKKTGSGKYEHVPNVPWEFYSGQGFISSSLAGNFSDVERVELALGKAQFLASNGQAHTHVQALACMATIDNLLDGVQEIMLEQKILLIDRIIWGASGYLRSNPKAGREALDAFLPTLEGICKFEGEEELKRIALYCAGTIGADSAWQQYIALKLALGIEGLGDVPGIHELMGKAVLASRSPYGMVRDSARKLAGKLSGRENTIGKLISSEKNGAEAALEFLAQEKSPGNIAIGFGFVYSLAVVGDEWGMEATKEMLRKTGAGIIGRERFLEINTSAICMAQIMASGNPGGFQERQDSLMKLMKEKGWFREEGVPGKEGVPKEKGKVSGGVGRANALYLLSGCLMVDPLILGHIGEKLAKTEGAMPLKEIKETFGAITETMRRGEVARVMLKRAVEKQEEAVVFGVGLRMALINEVFCAVEKHAEENPRSLVGATDAALGALGKLCEFEQPENITKLGEYCAAHAILKGEAFRYPMFRLLLRLGDAGIAIYSYYEALPIASGKMLTSWESAKRKVARQMTINTRRKIIGENDVVAEVFSASTESCAKAVANFLQEETDVRILNVLFTQAYICAVRGSEWGMDVAVQMILQMYEAPVTAEEMDEARVEALEGWNSHGKDEAAEGMHTDAVRRAKMLDKVMRNHDWSCAKKEGGAIASRVAIGNSRATCMGFNLIGSAIRRLEAPLKGENAIAHLAKLPRK